MQITTPLENDQLRSAIARAIGLCAYVDSILNQSAAFDMMAIAVQMSILVFAGEACGTTDPMTLMQCKAV